jgi:acyl carrier protein
VSEPSQDVRAISTEILEVILAEGGVDRTRLTPDATLETLGLASIDLVMALMTIEEKFGVYIPLDNELTEAKNLEDFVDSVAGRIVKERSASAS